MPLPSLYPLFMLNPFVSAAGGGGDIVITLMADPDIVLESDISIAVSEQPIDIEIEPEIEIEVE